MFVAARCLPVVCGVCGADAGDRLPEPESIVDKLARESLQRLAYELLGAQAQITSFELTPLSVAAAIRQLGPARYAVASITLGDAEATFTIALPPALLVSLLPLRAELKQDKRIESRKSALGEQSVKVEVELGDTEVSVRGLAQLAVGDVIVMDHPLSELGSLVVASGGRVGRVSLG